MNLKSFLQKTFQTINVGKTDRFMRLLLGIFLLWFGLFPLSGLKGNFTGIVVAALSLLPFYIVITRACPIFTFFNFHTLSKKECEINGSPYQKKTGA